MNVLFYLIVYYANTFQLLLTYTNDAAKFRLGYEIEKKKTNNYPMHVSRSPGVRCRRRCHMSALPLSAKVK